MNFIKNVGLYWIWGSVTLLCCSQLPTVLKCKIHGTWWAFNKCWKAFHFSLVLFAVALQASLKREQFLLNFLVLWKTMVLFKQGNIIWLRAETLAMAQDTLRLFCHLSAGLHWESYLISLSLCPHLSKMVCLPHSVVRIKHAHIIKLFRTSVQQIGSTV